MAASKVVSGKILMVLGAVALGAVMFLLGQASVKKAPRQGVGVPVPELSVWQRSLKVGGKAITVEGGGKASLRASGLVAYRMRGVPALLEWEQPGRWPVLDVPKDWVVAWVDGGQVVAVSNPTASGEGDRNVVVPAKPVSAALVVPVSLGVKVGDQVQG